MANLNSPPSSFGMATMIAREYANLHLEKCPDSIKETEEYKKGFKEFMEKKDFSAYTYGQLNARKIVYPDTGALAENCLSNKLFGIDPLQVAFAARFGLFS